MSEREAQIRKAESKSGAIGEGKARLHDSQVSSVLDMALTDTCYWCLYVLLPGQPYQQHAEFVWQAEVGLTGDPASDGLQTSGRREKP